MDGCAVAIARRTTRGRTPVSATVTEGRLDPSHHKPPHAFWHRSDHQVEGHISHIGTTHHRPVLSV